MTRVRRFAVIVCLALPVLSSTSLAQGRPLKILLTNDDGYEAPGLLAMQAALVGAGHHVTVVAPATNMSSTSMSMTSGVIVIDRKGEEVWAVHGTPGDAALIGLAHVLKNVPQDLVVSGTNAGQNLGTSTNTSGTVSAALVAARYGVPAIATSAGVGPEAPAAYRLAGELTIRMIAALAARAPAGNRLLPERFVINMNVPTTRIAGIKWAPLSRSSAFAREYSSTTNPNEVRSRLVAATPPGSETDTDFALFARGYVTLSLLDGDLSAGTAPAAASVISSLSTLALPEPAVR
ncbi:MAG TPA: 5'/3'-nucleotidase SurE [Vicinamibacterales bacterium]|jgi:5'/3'-nucleotidase SurE